MRKKLFYSFLVLASILMVSEVLLRILFHEQLKMRINTASFYNDSILGFMPVPKTIEYLVSPSVNNKLTVNSQGFYGREFQTKKQPGYYRIVVVGSSNESGNYTESNKSFVDICDEMFRIKNYKIELINCSFGGINRDVDKLKLIEHRIYNFNPDLIILAINIPFNQANEARESYKGYLIDYDKNNKESERDVKNIIDGLFTIKYKIITLVYNCSYILRTALKKTVADQPDYLLRTPFKRSMQAYVRKRAKALDEIGLVYTTEESIKELCRLTSKLNQNNIKLKLLSYHKEEHNIDLCKIDFINLSLKFDRSHILANDGHFNDKGHQLIAHKLYEVLTSDHIVPHEFLNN